jgi:hypothetical protein
VTPTDRRRPSPTVSAAEIRRRGDEQRRRGLQRERVVLARLIFAGYEVETQAPGAPFDARVNGIRLDVKTAEWTDYPQRRGRVRGFRFASLKRGATCDAFLLVGFRDDKADAWFVIPAAEVNVQSITITPRTLEGHGRWGWFRNAFHIFAR